MTDQHGGNSGNRIGLKKVGGHTGAVTHIVSNIVGNRCRISGVVLGDTRLDLSDQVCTNIGALCEDSAAQPCENRNQAAAKTKGHQGNNVMGYGIVPGDGCQCQSGHYHTGNRTAFKGHRKSGRKPFSCSLCCSYIGDNRHPHTDIPCDK